MPRFKRIMIKLSGELFLGKLKYGIDMGVMRQVAKELEEISEMGIEVLVEVGGGNIYRWRDAAKGIRRNNADIMGMLGSVMNAINLRDAVQKEARALSPIYMPYIIQYYTPGKTINYLQEKKIVIIGGGTAHQFFTTDSGAVLHALQTDCEIILKGTNVDGIYDSDPNKNPKAKRFNQITFDEVLSKKLEIMDMTAFALCRDNNLPIIIFDATQKGNIKKAAMGEKIGTLVLS